MPRGSSSQKEVAQGAAARARQQSEAGLFPARFGAQMDPARKKAPWANQRNHARWKLVTQLRVPPRAPVPRGRGSQKAVGQAARARARQGGAGRKTKLRGSQQGPGHRQEVPWPSGPDCCSVEGIPEDALVADGHLAPALSRPMTGRRQRSALSNSFRIRHRRHPSPLYMVPGERSGHADWLQ